MRISPVNNYQTNNRKNVNFGAVKGDCETILTIANRIGVDLTHPYEPESALIGLLDEAEIALLGHNHPKVYYPNADVDAIRKECQTGILGAAFREASIRAKAAIEIPGEKLAQVLDTSKLEEAEEAVKTAQTKAKNLLGLG